MCGTIEIRDVVLDAVKYPAEDWMKVIILGFLTLLSFIGILTEINIFTLLFLTILPLPLGYLFKIIKSSFKGSDDLPDFNNWRSMYTDGLRLILVLLIYSIPLVGVFLFFNYTVLFNLNIPGFSLYLLWSWLLGSFIQVIIFLLIGLVEYIAIANMALYEGEIRAAFRFREIIQRISMIGWKEYLIYYAIIWILGILTALISLLSLSIMIGFVIIPLLIAPYFVILNTRFLALVFASSEL
jgi:hypothetical protein